MPQKNYFFYCLSLLVITNCQLAEVHLDCPSGDCTTATSTAETTKTPTFSGYYRLKTKFRGGGESLEDGLGLTRIMNGGIFMNVNEDTPHQLWRLDTLDNGFFRLKSKASGDDLSLEANGAASPVRNGASFMNSHQNVIGQIWYLEPMGEDYYRLRTPLHENNCLEGNEQTSPEKDGAAFMRECSMAIGQLWQLEEVLE